MTDVVIVSETEIVAVDDTVGGGGGGAPSGAAGGVLGGTYPNPSFAADMATQAELDAHVSDASAAHAASAVSASSTTLVGTGTDVQAVLEELDNGIADHLADASAAHAATAVSFTPAGTIAATTVQAAIEEVASEAGSGSGVALTQAIAQTAHGLAVGDLVRYNGTAYVKGQADSAANAEVIGIVPAVADANNFTLLTDGKVTGLSGMTAGVVYFLSPSTAGAKTTTEPSAVGQVSKPVLLAVSTTVALYLSMRGIVIGADVATQAELDAHAADTTSVHGITDMSALYQPGGTDVALADGGTGASLTDPGADRILFWDESAGVITWLTASTGLSIAGTSMTSSGGGGSSVASDTIFDAKGDLAVGTGADTAERLAAGTNFNDALIPDSSLSGGMRWAKPRSALRPSGALYETFNRGQLAPANVAAILTSQRISVTAIDLPNDLLITSISFFSGGTAMVTGVHQIFGLYDSSRNLLRATTDDTSAAWTGTAKKTLNLTSTFTTTYSGLHYLAILVDATTVPTLQASNTAGGNVFTEAPILAGISNTGVTSLPNPATAFTATTNMIWAWVS